MKIYGKFMKQKCNFNDIRYIMMQWIQVAKDGLRASFVFWYLLSWATSIDMNS